MTWNDTITASVQAFRDLADRHPDEAVLRADVERTIADVEEGCAAHLDRSPDDARLPVTTGLLTQGPGGETLVHVYAWIGVQDIADGFRAMIAQAESYPGRAIYPADITRTLTEIEHRALIEAADTYGCDWRLLTRAASPEPVQ